MDERPVRNEWKGSQVRCPHCGSDETLRFEGSAVWGRRWRWRAFTAAVVFECPRCGHLDFFKADP